LKSLDQAKEHAHVVIAFHCGPLVPESDGCLTPIHNLEVSNNGRRALDREPRAERGDSVVQVKEVFPLRRVDEGGLDVSIGLVLQRATRVQLEERVLVLAKGIEYLFRRNVRQKNLEARYVGYKEVACADADVDISVGVPESSDFRRGLTGPRYRRQ